MEYEKKTNINICCDLFTVYLQKNKNKSDLLYKNIAC